VHSADRTTPYKGVFALLLFLVRCCCSWCVVVVDTDISREKQSAKAIEVQRANSPLSLYPRCSHLQQKS
jgi:hypothetical protein